MAPMITRLVFFYSTVSITLLSMASAYAEQIAKAFVEQMPSSHVLDGRTFIIRNGEMGKAASQNDKLIFKDGTFFSASGAESGFGHGPIKVTVDGDLIRFETKTVSPKHGTITWQGAIHGHAINGTYTWTKEYFFGTKQTEKWFRGTLKP